MESSDILRTIEQAGECYIITDAAGVIQYASPGVERMSGYSPAELVGRSTRIFKSDRNPSAQYESLWETILARQVWTGILENRSKSGETQPERLTISPITNEKNEITSFFCRKEVATGEPSIESRIPAYLLRNTPIEQRNMNEFMERMSYELRTALNSILGFSQILHEDLRERIDEAHNEYFTIVEQSGSRLLHLVEGVLLLSQLDSGNFAFQFQRFPIAHEIRRIISNISLMAGRHDLRFIKVIEDNGALVSMDKNCFEQIITNLLINAIKFTDKGTITVGLETRSGEVVISVIDTGMGISDTFKPMIFTPFQQEEIGYNSEFEGVGLGLAATKRMTEIMGGRISFESKKGEGSTFVVRFPIVSWEKDLVMPLSAGSI